MTDTRRVTLIGWYTITWTPDCVGISPVFHFCLFLVQDSVQAFSCVSLVSSSRRSPSPVFPDPALWKSTGQLLCRMACTQVCLMSARVGGVCECASGTGAAQTPCALHCTWRRGPRCRAVSSVVLAPSSEALPCHPLFSPFSFMSISRGVAWRLCKRSVSHHTSAH